MTLLVDEKYNYIRQFLHSVSLASDLQGQHVQGYYDSMDDDDRVALEKRIAYLCEIEGNSISNLTDSYMAWCGYFTEERKYFVRHGGEYRNHSFAEIDAAYKDPEYMKNYMIGLSLSAYLWDIQRQNLKFFKRYCAIDKHKGGKYLEIGPGHGEYLSTAVENTNFDYYLGVDISDSAAKQTKSFLSYQYKEKPEILRKIEVRNQDFFDMDENDKYDAIVISQVIEHVEDPKSFLHKVLKLAKTGALIYVSTAINSPFPDHIYHFHNSEEVRRIVRECGLDIVSEFQSTADGMSLERAIKKNYDIVIGFILKDALEGNESDIRSYKYTDLSVGMKESFKVKITESMMDAFCQLSGDNNPLHRDQAFARMNGYEDKVVYGMLTNSLFSRLVGMYLPGKNAVLLSIDSKFKQPVYVGDEIEVIGTVEEMNSTMRLLQISATASKLGQIAVRAKIKVGFLNETMGELKDDKR